MENPLTMYETQVQSLGQEDFLEKNTATHSSILAWETPWSPMGYSPQGRTQLHDSRTHNQLYQCFLTAALTIPKKRPPQ